MSYRTVDSMSDWEIEQWSSFKLYFDKIWPVIGKATKLIELGAGLFSTPYFLEHCDSFISYEHNDEWLTAVRKELPDIDIRELDLEDLKKELSNTEVLFVDGVDRHEMVELGMACGVPIILIHDFSQEDADKIKLHKDYIGHTGIGMHFNPTGLYTNRLDIYKAYCS